MKKLEIDSITKQDNGLFLIVVKTEEGMYHNICNVEMKAYGYDYDPLFGPSDIWIDYRRLPT